VIILISEGQLKKLKKSIKKVKCQKCGWEWNLSDGEKDPYTCHKCGNKRAKLEEEDDEYQFKGLLTDKQVKSIEQLNKDAKFITCRNCRHKFTQTTYKKKKSLPICPTCGTHNVDKR
jgi:Zn finger protein HypA/HybF involved in hydrogenase expression